MVRQRWNPTSYPDPFPDMVVERGPDERGVGLWVPEEKHRYLSKFIGASSGARRKWTNRVYIDLFSGPGRIQVEGEGATREGGALVAWRQGALHPEAQFTHVFVADKNAERVAACRARLEAAGAPVQAFEGAAVETAPQVLAAVPANAFCLAYLDPYNLQYLSFDVIECLARLRRIDFAVHFSTMDLNRNVEVEFTRGRFDETAPGWSKAIDPSASSRTRLREAFFDYWCGLIKQLGFTFSENMPLIKSNSSAPLYRLVFFSRHPLGKRLLDDIARPETRDLFAGGGEPG